MLTKRISAILSVLILLLCMGTAHAGPPLPFHSIEGNSGVFITSTAYLANAPEEGKIAGRPSFSMTGAFIGEKQFQAVALTQNFYGIFELGYAAERIGLGNWPDEVFRAASLDVNGDVYQHNLNVRANIIKEGRLDNPWIPAVTLGSHFKWNCGLSDINEQLGGLCNELGADHYFGTEFTLVASKTITNLLPRPLMVSAGVRNGDAIHTGFLGFAGEREFTFEGSLVYFLTDNLLVATEYRQKTDQADTCTINGYDLVMPEDDWYDLCLGYIVDDHITLAFGYANFGNILNHDESNVWAFQFKYEF